MLHQRGGGLELWSWGLLLAMVSTAMGCGRGAPTSDATSVRPYYSSTPQVELANPQAAAESEQGQGPGMGGDRFDLIVENSFVPAREQPLSTFSIDVDTASYSKTRMFLMQQRTLPPADAVRIEELINYFDYEYSEPAGEHPFAVHVEVTEAPWQARHLLARIGLKGRALDDTRPAANLVFLVDVSGSMNHPRKLPLVQQSLRLLASQLNADDRVSIVVYAGAAGAVLPPTPGDDRQRILGALNSLEAGGSTNGGEGIQLAYRFARENFIERGINRVMLCSDGDFNVGTTSTGALVRLAETEARSGVYLSVLGFGIGNHNDAMLEELSNKANGNYAFIDTPEEARKVLCDQMQGTLLTIAKDVKLQIEFNPAHIAAYRLIGYENRHLEAHEFNDDRKDAGEIGAAHTVTALYELIPAGATSSENLPTVDPLKYQNQSVATEPSHELLTVKVRYKSPQEDVSQLIEVPVAADIVPFAAATTDSRFAAAVAAFGMLLRQSQYSGEATWETVAEIGQAALGADRHGYRAEFLELVSTARKLSGADDTRRTAELRR